MNAKAQLIVQGSLCRKKDLVAFLSFALHAFFYDYIILKLDNRVRTENDIILILSRSRAFSCIFNFGTSSFCEALISWLNPITPF